MDINKQIIEARKAKGYTQESLARSTNLSIRTIQRIEKGKGNPRSHTLIILSNFLDLELLKKDTTDQDKTLKKEQNTISLITYTSLIFSFIPLLNFCIPLSIWLRNQDSRAINSFGKKVVHFQVLWFAALLLSILLVPIITHFSTEQVAHGQFPSLQLVYLLFVVINIITVLQFYSNTTRAVNSSKIGQLN